MFRIPESIAQLGKNRIEGSPVEGFVYGEGPKNPELMLIGEAPGEFELVDGIPFIGRAGKELMKSLATIGLSREDVYITSAVRSRPYRWGTKKRARRDNNGTEIQPATHSKRDFGTCPCTRLRIVDSKTEINCHAW